MQAGKWLLLTDYASKYRVSVSTLRRRIKHQQIHFRFDGGKYFLLDAPPSAPEAIDVYKETLVFPGLRPVTEETTPINDEAEAKLKALEDHHATPTAVPMLSSATKLLNELKRAYTNILQEKEEQIIQLKEEVSDLKTLVRVLEDDNERMRRFLGSRPAPQM